MNMNSDCEKRFTTMFLLSRYTMFTVHPSLKWTQIYDKNSCYKFDKEKSTMASLFKVQFFNEVKI